MGKKGLDWILKEKKAFWEKGKKGPGGKGGFQPKNGKEDRGKGKLGGRRGPERESSGRKRYWFKDFNGLLNLGVRKTQKKRFGEPFSSFPHFPGDLWTFFPGIDPLKLLGFLSGLAAYRLQRGKCWEPPGPNVFFGGRGFHPGGNPYNGGGGHF